ncbi:MAG TPA: hypothetical protein VFZ59_22765 [Verrucomicrobiae bacterium]|nr:hypothetical protein [Verrucomicrobiae bacterium]
MNVIKMNRMSQGSIAAALTAFSLLLSNGTSHGAFVDYSASYSGTDTLSTFGVTWDTKTGATVAGAILLTKSSGDASMPGSFLTVCLDIGGTLLMNRTYGYSASTPFAGQSGINPLWGSGNADGLKNSANAMAAIQAAANLFYTHSSVLSSGTSTERAALQLAVWEALYDTAAGSQTYGLSDGRFQITSGNAAAITLASTWLSAVDPNALYVGYLLKPDPSQQYGTDGQEFFFNVSPVPEASTVIAGALLLLPFAASTVRALRKSNAAKS